MWFFKWGLWSRDKVMQINFFTRKKYKGKLKWSLLSLLSTLPLSFPPWCIRRQTWVLISMSTAQPHPSYRKGTVQLPGQGTAFHCSYWHPAITLGQSFDVDLLLFNDMLGHSPHLVLLMSRGILLLCEIGIGVRYFVSCSTVLSLLGQREPHKRSGACSRPLSHEFLFLGVGFYTAHVFALQCLH